MIGPKDSYDTIGSATSELLYDCVAMTYDSYMARFGLIADNARESHYFTYCWDIANVFGCLSLRKKQYCILNKQYTKAEYEALVPKIIAQMNELPYIGEKGRKYRYGEFFPVEFSPFAYNESIAQEYFPLTKSEIEERGYRWREPDIKKYDGAINSNKLPVKTSQATDAILNDVISCDHGAKCNELCTVAFKITPAELAYYRQFKIPLPHLCPNCRHYARLAVRNPLKLWPRQCMCLSGEAFAKSDAYKNTVKHFHGEAPCPNKFETSYAPERPETIYCEACYQAEIV
jgi:hypothetical protein